MKIITLENYIQEQKVKFKKLKDKINLFEKVSCPLTIQVYNDSEDSFQLFSADYRLAQDFNICKRRNNLESSSGPDGGYSKDRIESYPQFYFNLSNIEEDQAIRVYIQHYNFEKDSRIIINSTTITRGWKDFSSENRTIKNYVNLDNVFNFFSSKGVKPVLLKKLKTRINEAEELNHG